VAPLELVLDTDIGSDVDDALALALAVRDPRIDLRAVATVSGDTQLRARIARQVLEAAGRTDVPVAAGVATDARPIAASGWPGHEAAALLGDDAGRGTSPDGVAALRAEAPGRALATVGSQTNLAAALATEPALAERIPRLAVMGGAFAVAHVHGMAVGPREDYNLQLDPAAADRALNAGIPTLYVPLDVTVQTYLTTAHRDALAAGDELCRLLARMIDVWAPILRRTTRGRLPSDHVAALHDPLTVACLVDPGFVTLERLPVTVAVHDGHARTFVDPAYGREADVVRSVDAAAFADCLVDTLLGR
jgi:purine nucleosidase